MKRFGGEIGIDRHTAHAGLTAAEEVACGFREPLGVLDAEQGIDLAVREADR